MVRYQLHDNNNQPLPLFMFFLPGRQYWVSGGGLVNAYDTWEDVILQTGSHPLDDRWGYLHPVSR